MKKPRTKIAIEAGKCYLHKRGLNVTVRKVTGIAGNRVTYQVVYTSLKKRDIWHGGITCNIGNFCGWADQEIDEREDYSNLRGAVIYDTYLVYGTKNQLLFRCSSKKAEFYIRKGYATVVGDKTIQFTNDTTEKTLESLYGNDFNDFWFEVKNDKCCVCGSNNHGLTRHHVVPQRHLDKIPILIRRSISNILFICWECHSKYEEIVYNEQFCPIVDDGTDFIYAWRDHFLDRMNPQFLPKGWEIVVIKNPESIGRRDCLTDNQTGERP